MCILNALFDYICITKSNKYIMKALDFKIGDKSQYNDEVFKFVFFATVTLVSQDYIITTSEKGYKTVFNEYKMRDQKLLKV